MIGENQRELVPDEPVKFEKYPPVRLKFIKTSGELPITSEEFMEYTSNSYTTGLDLQTLGESQPIVPQTFPDQSLR
jgi:hypothetical protein